MSAVVSLGDASLRAASATGVFIAAFSLQPLFGGVMIGAEVGERASKHRLHEESEAGGMGVAKLRTGSAAYPNRRTRTKASQYLGGRRPEVGLLAPVSSRSRPHWRPSLSIQICASQSASSLVVFLSHRFS